MARTFIRQDTQIRKSDVYDDTLGTGATVLETNSTDIEYDLNALRSQHKRAIWADAAGDWHADIPTITSIGAAKKRGINELAIHVDALEEHRILFRTQLLTDIAVPAAAKATDTLTLNSAPLDAETVTIGSTTYTFKTALTPANWEVLIEATASASLDNLIWAINNEAGHPGKFQVPNANPDVTVAAGAGDTMDVTAIVDGTKANLVATTETLSDVLSVWTTATLTGGAGDVVVLSVAGSEAPSENGAVGAVSTAGAVVAYNSDFENWKLVKVSSTLATKPKNLCVVRDATTKEVITSGGMDVYALLACEDPTDDQVFDDLTQQVELIFVRENSAGTDLEQVPGADIGGKTINYSYVQRIDLDSLPEDAFLSEVFLDIMGTVNATRQVAYDNQSTTPVELTTDATLDLALTKAWSIRDALNADLFKITEASGASTTTIALGSDVDVFDVNALVNDFAKGVTVDSSGVDLQLGITALANIATIDTLAGNDLRLMGTRELFMDDGNQAGSSWAQTEGIKLSDTTAEWSAYETRLGGELSLLAGIVKASKMGSRRIKTYANVTAETNAGTDVGGVGGGANLDAQLPDMSNGTWLQDYDIIINGELLEPEASYPGTNDYAPGTSLVNGQLKFEFKVKLGDKICVIAYDADDVP